MEQSEWGISKRRMTRPLAERPEPVIVLAPSLRYLRAKLIKDTGLPLGSKKQNRKKQDVTGIHMGFTDGSEVLKVEA